MLIRFLFKKFSRSAIIKIAMEPDAKLMDDREISPAPVFGAELILPGFFLPCPDFFAISSLSRLPNGVVSS